MPRDPDNNQNRSVMLTIRTLAAVSIRISGPSKLLRTRNMGTLTVPNTLPSIVVERRRRLFDSDQKASDGFGDLIIGRGQHIADNLTIIRLIFDH